MMSTQSNPGGSSVWWVIGIVMLPVGALLWAWSQQPVEDVVSELAAKPFAADVLEENRNLSGNNAGDLSAMSREEIGAAYNAVLQRLNDSAEAQLAEIRLGMAASVAAFCFWCIAVFGFLKAGSAGQGVVKALKPDDAVHPAAGRSGGLAGAGL